MNAIATRLSGGLSGILLNTFQPQKTIGAEKCGVPLTILSFKTVEITEQVYLSVPTVFIILFHLDFTKVFLSEAKFIEQNVGIYVK